MTWIERRASSNGTCSAAASAERIGPPCVIARTCPPSCSCPIRARPETTRAPSSSYVSPSSQPWPYSSQRAKPSRVPLLDLRAREPGPRADVDLLQRRVWTRLEVELVGEDGRGLGCAPQRARVRGREAPGAELGCERPCLRPPGVVERRIRVTLEAAVAVPVGLAVPHEDDRRRHGGYGSARGSRARAGSGASSPGSTGGIGLEIVRQLVGRGRARRLVRSPRRARRRRGRPRRRRPRARGRARARGRRGRCSARRARRPRQQRRQSRGTRASRRWPTRSGTRTGS